MKNNPAESGTMKRRTLRALAFLACLLLLPLAAGAATPINEVRPLDPTGSIDIENLKGTIHVRGWDRDEVRITGSLGEGVERLVLEGDRGKLQVKVKYPRSSGWGRNRSEPTDLRLMVPLRAKLDIESVSARVDVADVASRELSIDSVSGAILVVGAPAKVDVDSVSGGIRMTVNSSDVSVDSVSGSIYLRGRMDGEIKAGAVSGSIDVAVNGERIRRFSADTVSGSISLDTALQSGAKVDMESVSGRLRLTLPADLSAEVRAESLSGSLRAPGATVVRPRHGPGSSLEHRYGGGEGQIKLETLSGAVEVQLR